MKAKIAKSQAKPAPKAPAQRLSDWDDLRVVLALARGRTLQEAARRLGGDPSTVFRRARAVEKRIGVRLFERTREGYLLTEAGEAAAQAAERVEAEVVTLESRVGCGDAAAAGTLRVTTTDTVLNDLLLPRLPAFAERYPELRLELAAANEFVDLTKRDADIAIRSTRKPPEHLVGRPLGLVRWALYAHRKHAQGLGERIALEAARWIALDDSLAQHPSRRWQERSFPKADVVLRLNTVTAMRQALEHGLGVGVVPCFVGDASSELARVGAPIAELDSDEWVLTHRDYRGLARVRAFFAFAEEAIAPVLRASA